MIFYNSMGIKYFVIKIYIVIKRNEEMKLKIVFLKWVGCIRRVWLGWMILSIGIL